MFLLPACVRAGHCQLSLAVACVGCALLAAGCVLIPHARRCPQMLDSRSCYPRVTPL